MLFGYLSLLCGKDILDVSEYLGGKFLKVIIGTLYIVLFMLTTAMLIKYFSERLKLIYFHNTPITLIVLGFFVGMMVVNKVAHKSITRVNTIITFVLLFNIVILIIATSEFFTIENLFPILGEGVNATFFTGLSNLFAFEGFGYLFFLMPLLKNSNDFKKVAISSTIICGIYLFLSVTCLLLVFSYVAQAEETLVMYSLSRIAQFGDFIQRADALYIFLWILSVLSYCSVSLYFITYIFKKITNLTDQSATIYCFCLVMFGICFSFVNIAFSIFVVRNIFNYYRLILIFGISILILIFANIKIRRKKEQALI